MEFLHHLHDATYWKGLISGVGPTLAYVILFAIIFAETGLLVGFFLPGDSLLFVAGLVASQTFGVNIGVLIPLLCVAAVAGDAVGYQVGRRIGRPLFEKPNSRLFKREHLVRTQAFYDKHGPKTIVIARFVPIVRTFAPTVAGVANMPYKQFVAYNVAGGIGWITSMCLLGYFLGQLEVVEKNLSKAVLLIVFLSILPMIIHYIQERRHAGPVESAVESATTVETAP